MTSSFAERIAARLASADDDLREEVAAQRRRWRYRIHRGRAWFGRERRAAHRRLREGIVRWISRGSVLSLVSAPVIYSLIVPFALLDAWVTLYQTVCFRIYGIPRVRRRSYFALDRHRLAYLNGIEKVNCTYCSYANGVLAYVREVAAQTEQYWCPIKHATAIPSPHRRYHFFFDYGDGQTYRRELPTLRGQLRTDPPAPGRAADRSRG